MSALSIIPCWYAVLAIVVSFYQCYRGFMLQYFLNRQRIESTAHRVTLLCIADAFTYLVCSLTGFYALFLLYRLCEKPEPPSVPLAIFLAVYGLLGVTAKLPEILGKLQLLK